MSTKPRLKIENNINPEFETEHAIDISGSVENEGLTLTFAYNNREFDRAGMERITSIFKSNLQKIIDYSVEKKQEIEKLGKNAAAYHIEQDYEKYREQIGREKWTDLSDKHDYKHILLTGATGYLGAYLAYELLNKTGATLYLPVRGTTKEQAEERLKKKMAFYFGEHFFETKRDRIVVLHGDLTEDRLGIDKTRYNQLCETVEAVMHSAANVKHYGAYDEFYKDNVESTEHLLEFALTQKKKAFHFISTVDTGRGDIPGRDHLVFTEYCLDQGQKAPFVYGKSKLEAEKRVYAYREKGLDTFIYRAGNMTFNSETGRFQENIQDNFTYSMMKTLIKVGFWSDRMRNLNLDLSFVDFAAQAIVKLFTSRGLKNEIFHIFNPNTMSWKEMALLLKEIGVEVEELKEERDRFAKFESESELGKLIERVKLYSWIWEDKGGTLTVPKADRTVAILKQIGFQWPEVTKKHIEKMVAHCKEVGFL